MDYGAPAMDETALQEKLRKIEALHAGTTSDGEREAARLAAERDSGALGGAARARAGRRVGVHVGGPVDAEAVRRAVSCGTDSSRSVGTVSATPRYRSSRRRASSTERSGRSSWRCPRSCEKHLSDITESSGPRGDPRRRERGGGGRGAEGAA